MRFELDREDKGFTAKLIDQFYKHPNNFISSLLVGNNIALVIYGILMAELINELLLIPCGLHTPSGYCPNDGLCLFIQTILSTLVVLVTGEFLPKTLFRINSNRTMHICAPLAYFFYILLWPISKFTSSIGKFILKLMGQKVERTSADHAFTKVDLDHLIQSNIDNIENEEEIEDEVKMFQNALDFSNVKVRDCIVPRTELDAIEENTDLKVLQNHFIESGHSKIVVYHEDIDNILGYIHSSEMFRLSHSDNWKNSIREVPIVPETMSAQKLLSIFMNQKRSLAVVVDEFGGTSGIVTFEDLVEEIFGDIEEELNNLYPTEEREDYKMSLMEEYISEAVEDEMDRQNFDLEEVIKDVAQDCMFDMDLEELIKDVVRDRVKEYLEDNMTKHIEEYLVANNIL